MTTLYQSYSLTESEFESPMTMLAQKVIIPSGGLVVLDLRSQIIRCQNYTQNFIHDSKKSQDCTAESPNPKFTPNSQDPGKNPKQWERCWR